MHLEILVEELSAEAALRILLPKIMRDGTTHALRPFQGKPDLIRQLPARLRAYARWAQSTELGVVVLIDEDRQDCKRLKADLEDAASAAGVPTKAPSSPAHHSSSSIGWLSRSSKHGFSETATRSARRIQGFPTPSSTGQHIEGPMRSEVEPGRPLSGFSVRRATTRGGCPRWRWPSSSRRTSFPLGTALRASGTSAPAFAL